MRQWFLCATAVAVLLPPGLCAAQTPTLEQLAERIDALERKVDDLEREKQALLEAMSLPPPSPAPPEATLASAAPAPVMPTPIAFARQTPGVEGDGDLWSGSYFGLSTSAREIGYSTEFSTTYPGVASESSLSAGPQIGYRWQEGPFVTGLEFGAHLYDSDYAVFSEQISDDYSPTTGYFHNIVRIDRTLEARAMVGLAWSRWLGYSFFGMRTRTAQQRVLFIPIDRIDSTKFDNTEPFFGGGAAYMFPGGSSVELEYAFSKDGDMDWLETDRRMRVDSKAWTLRLNQQF